MHALLIGATGATGNDLLALLLNDETFHLVEIFVRRDVDVYHEKLKVHVIDFDHPEQWSSLVKGDVLFSCLGTTLKAAGSKDAQWKIDYDYQFQFAKAAAENNVPQYVLVSAAYAKADAWLFYSKMKGKLEDAVRTLGFKSISIFKPSMLIRKNTDRSGELTGSKVIRFFNKLGLLRSQKPMPTEILAHAMVNIAKLNATGVALFQGNDIWRNA